jgi:hypothetical protein
MSWLIENIKDKNNGVEGKIKPFFRVIFPLLQKHHGGFSTGNPVL